MMEPGRDQNPGSDVPLRIVLLEDSPLDAELIEARLSELGRPFELQRADGRVAFEQALRAGCALVLSDYNVPGFDGVSAMTLARQLCPASPFLFVTGALGEDRAIELLKQGATDYVLKDRLERLVPGVERALREAQEIAERRRAEQRLLERERTLSNLMRNLPGMVFRRRGDQTHFDFASEGALDLSGFEPEVFCVGGALNWMSLIHEEDQARVAAESSAAFAERRQLSSIYRIRAKHGATVWVWDRAVARYDETGAIDYIEGFITDFTLQKQVEVEALRRAEFEQQLIGIVSHDLRNPLNTIMLGSATLLKREGLDEQSTSLVRRVLRSSERAARMIRDLLDFTQVRMSGGLPVTPRPTDLHQLVVTVLDEMEQAHPTRVLSLEHHGDAQGSWDPDRIAQLIANLVGNALTYSPADSTVSVRVHGEVDAVLLSVHNAGTPISAEQLPRLFHPFTRGMSKTDLAARSIGLGLYIVDHIVQAHGGSVHVDSSAERGTTFSVRLPRVSSGAV